MPWRRREDESEGQLHKAQKRWCMTTSSNGNIYRVTGPLCGEFTGPGEFPTQSPVTRSFDVFFDLRVNKRLSKQSRGWLFETPVSSLWRHCNGSWNVSMCQCKFPIDNVLVEVYLLSETLIYHTNKEIYATPKLEIITLALFFFQMIKQFQQNQSFTI